MRRITVAIGMLAFIVTTIIIGNIIVKKQCEIFKEKIEDIKTTIKNSENLNANEKVEDIKGLWHKKKAIISVFSNHGPLDEITVRIDELACATEIDDKNKAMILTSQIIAYVDRITEEQRIHTESFF